MLSSISTPVSAPGRRNSGRSGLARSPRWGSAVAGSCRFICTRRLVPPGETGDWGGSSCGGVSSSPSPQATSKALTEEARAFSNSLTLAFFSSLTSTTSSQERIGCTSLSGRDCASLGYKPGVAPSGDASTSGGTSGAVGSNGFDQISWSNPCRFPSFGGMPGDCGCPPLASIAASFSAREAGGVMGLRTRLAQSAAFSFVSTDRKGSTSFCSSLRGVSKCSSPSGMPAMPRGDATPLESGEAIELFDMGEPASLYSSSLSTATASCSGSASASSSASSSKDAPTCGSSSEGSSNSSSTSSPASSSE
mmetsp:Transcript_19728/g.41994  ORF Transcript_19728/g.41994 Transcript_19728/m.41994 type:complete len:307 (+) Transcript_19728:913-1833(+)